MIRQRADVAPQVKDNKCCKNQQMVKEYEVNSPMDLQTKIGAEEKIRKADIKDE